MGGHEGDLLQKYESKTSFILKDELETKVFNITLESVLAGTSGECVHCNLGDP
jgi:hypothetical protein